MDRRTELGEFLRSRRARLQPDDVGLRPFAGARRVPGLRREELAQLAGVSVDYYVRLEQGRSRNVSATVLDAVARALRLSDDERSHLHNLAHPPAPGRPRRRRQQARPELVRLLAAMDGIPAYVIDCRTEVLAWNQLAAALTVDFATRPPDQRNWARLVFLDDEIANLFVDWESKARETVGYLQLSAGRHPDDPQLAQLVGDLSMGSEPFRRMWAAHDVRDKAHGSKGFRHPVVGELELAYQTLHLSDEPDQALVTYTATPGSPAEDALRLLASWTAAPETTPSTSSLHHES